MDGVLAGGHRRIDRVLGADFLAEIRSLTLPEVRELRDDVEQEETDLSYLRRMLQARLDLVISEATRRKVGDPAPTDMIAHLTAVLGEGERSNAHGLGRHTSVEPTRAGESRRHVEQLVSDSLLMDLPSLDDDTLAAALTTLRDEETAVSARRTAVQEVLDAVTGEITRRYRDGEASVDSLLTDGRGIKS